MLKGLASSNIGATEVTAATTLTAGRIPMGDGARGLADTGAGTIGTSLAIAGATIGTNALAVTGTAAISGAVTGATWNGLTITSTTGTFTLTGGKTVAVTHSLTLSGTDSTVMTFPTTTATLARTDAGQTFTGTQVFGLAQVATSVTYTAAAAGPILKQGANGRCGTFVANGVTPVTVSNTSIAITDAIIISLNTVGGTVGANPPDIQTITAGVGFTVAGLTLDTSTYNYAIIKNAA